MNEDDLVRLEVMALETKTASLELAEAVDQLALVVRRQRAALQEIAHGCLRNGRIDLDQIDRVARAALRGK